MKTVIHAFDMAHAKKALRSMIDRGADAYDVVIVNPYGQYLGTNMESDAVCIFFYPDDEAYVGAEVSK